MFSPNYHDPIIQWALKHSTFTLSFFTGNFTWPKLIRETKMIFNFIFLFHFLNLISTFIIHFNSIFYRQVSFILLTSFVQLHVISLIFDARFMFHQFMVTFAFMFQLFFRLLSLSLLTFSSSLFFNCLQ